MVTGEVEPCVFGMSFAPFLLRSICPDGNDNPSAEEGTMKAGIIFTGTGPILILTSYENFSDPKFVEKLEQKGIKKFMAVEVPLADCEKKYGGHYRSILKDVKQEDDLRVLDYNGFNVFYNFPFSSWGKEYRHEA